MSRVRHSSPAGDISGGWAPRINGTFVQPWVRDSHSFPASTPTAETLKRRAEEELAWAERQTQDNRVRRAHGAAYGTTLRFPCTCGAEPFQPCIAVGGGERSRPHPQRIQTTVEWWEGKQAAGIADRYVPPVIPAQEEDQVAA